MLKTGLYWFSNDLRVKDNDALALAARSVNSLACVYIVDPAWFAPNRYGQKTIGEHRWRFLHETLSALKESLETQGQQLIIVYDSPLDALATLITRYDIYAIFRSQNAGYYENQIWRTLRRRYPLLQFEEVATHTLLTLDSLPFELEEFPATFSKFRKRVEPLSLATKTLAPVTLPPSPVTQAQEAPVLPVVKSTQPDSKFLGGTNEGKQHLANYFTSPLPSSYKEVRNALDGWENSTKFSPWLANGSISAKHIMTAVYDYEAREEANESTYWIQFELLWREYFQWLAHAYPRRLFSPSGIQKKKSLNAFYPERFQRWCQGNTPYPLVNACMKQLNATGYMSNRGRQIVASCFVNELNLDWRYGAAYFEQQLVDYDVAVNWGNWQYLAGVGTDPRGKRHFDIEKQTALYDPEGKFIEKWQGKTNDSQLDSVDAADWPITFE